MLQLYYEKKFVKVSYDEAWQLGITEWNGFVSSQNLQEAALWVLRFINTHGVTRWLADHRHMKAIRQHDQQWTVEKLIPKLLESPLRRMATVVSEDIFNNMAMEQILKKSGGMGDIVKRDFDNKAEALVWLKAPFAEAPAAAADLTTL